MTVMTHEHDYIPKHYYATDGNKVMFSRTCLKKPF